MEMILPDDVLGIIREFSRPYKTRPDWRTCKRHEAWRVEQFYRYQYFLLYRLAWYAVTDENGYRMFYDRDDVVRHLRETNMVSRVLRFEETVPLDLDILDLLYVWFEHNWAPGIAALPA
jgi:hypothetical protein